MYSYPPDLVIWSSVLCVNISKINQCNLKGEKKVNVNIIFYTGSYKGTKPRRK